MRLIGHLLDETQARRFTAFLIVQGVAVRAERDSTGWALWIRDEDAVPTARAALDDFLAAPADSRYAAAESQAVEKERAELARRIVVHRNTIDVHRRRREATTGPRPLTMTLAALSVLVFILTSGGDNFGSILGDLTFCRIAPDGLAPKNGFLTIQQGEVWRLVTPIFIHFGVSHLIFNLLTLFYLASPVERSRGTPTLGLMTLSIAVASNVLQYALSGNPLFGGLSGVLFGLIGYSWMKARQDPTGPIQMPRDALIFTLVFFFLGILREVPPFDGLLAPILPRMANTAHAVGLVMGIAYGWLPPMIRRWSAPAVPRD